jgi:hypothetical protein
MLNCTTRAQLGSTCTHSLKLDFMEVVGEWLENIFFSRSSYLSSFSLIFRANNIMLMLNACLSVDNVY